MKADGKAPSSSIGTWQLDWWSENASYYEEGLTVALGSVSRPTGDPTGRGYNRGQFGGHEGRRALQNQVSIINGVGDTSTLPATSVSLMAATYGGSGPGISSSGSRTGAGTAAGVRGAGARTGTRGSSTATGAAAGTASRARPARKWEGADRARERERERGRTSCRRGRRCRDSRATRAAPGRARARGRRTTASAGPIRRASPRGGPARSTTDPTT